MELRRFNDIVAFQWGQNAPLAFHAENMSLAEISQEAYSTLPLSSLTSTALNLEKSLEILPEIQSWDSEVDSDVTDVKLAKKVKSLTLNVTQICNLHCTYCAAGGDGSYGDPITRISIEKTLPQLNLFFSKLEKNDSFHITFLGGEPLLYVEAISAIGKYCQDELAAREIKPSFSIITNGTLITDLVLEKLAFLKAQFTLSFDGPKEIHDRFRPQKNGSSSFDQVFTGFLTLLRQPEKRGRLLIHSVFTKDQTDVVSVYNFFQQFKVDALEFTYDVTCNDPSGMRAFTESMKQTAQLAFEYGGEQELRRITLFDQYFELLDQQTRNRNHCGSGKTLMSIDSKNRVFACPLEINEPRTRIGFMNEISADPELLENSLIELNDCKKCWARNLCGGGCMYIHKMTTGQKHQKSPHYCEKQRDLISTALLYYYKTRS